MRVVIDTNVWVSGLMLPRSIPGRILHAALHGQITPVLSDSLVAEISAALHYRSVRPRLALTDEELERYVTELRYNCEIVDGATTRTRVPRDRKDDHVLAALLSSKADVLVTGDQDLLALRPRYAVLTPREFFDHHLV